MKKFSNLRRVTHIQTKQTLAKTFLAAVLIFGEVLSNAVQAETYVEAPVVSSTPVYRIIETSTPARECWQEEVYRDERDDGFRSRTPDILGAVVGGALGNSVGSRKRNKQVGTVVGAVLGASIARDITQSRSSFVDTVQRCQTVQNTTQEERLVGYDVAYDYDGIRRTVRMPSDPGSTVRLRVQVEPVF